MSYFCAEGAYIPGRENSIVCVSVCLCVVSREKISNCPNTARILARKQRAGNAYTKYERACRHCIFSHQIVNCPNTTRIFAHFGIAKIVEKMC